MRTMDDLDVHVVPLRRRHLRQVMRIEHQVYPRPWTAGVFMSELGRRDDRCYVAARAGSTVVGYAGQLYVGSDAHITNVAVDPAWHRRGVATQLMLSLVHAAVDHGAEHLTLEVRVTNRAAQELYRRFGFVPAGIRPRYYENTDDAIVMWANDVASPEFAARIEAIEARVEEARRG